ncbi:MAG: homoserine O-succinyltransferase [Xanthobacteraceae bacterium]
MPLFVDSAGPTPSIDLNAPNCISIGLINNMPDAALAATERQFSNLIRAANPNVVVLLKLFAMPDLPRGDEARRMLAERYRDISALWNTPLDGLIVTGTEPRANNLSDEPYWDSLSKVVDWARENTFSTIWSCLAAHAAVLHADGIERRALNEKRCGIFDCRLVADHPLTEHFPEPLWVPHSRYNDLPEQALLASGYKILTRSQSAGVDTFAKQDGSFFLFFQGHPEYEADSLLREYRRDVGRFLNCEREHYPVLPIGYFSPEGAAAAETFRAQALADPRAELTAEFPTAALETSLACPWRPAALGVYEKWCAFLSARKAERRSTAPKALPARPRRTWRDWPLGTRRMADTPVR